MTAPPPAPHPLRNASPRFELLRNLLPLVPLLAIASCASTDAASASAAAASRNEPVPAVVVQGVPGPAPAEAPSASASAATPSPGAAPPPSATRGQIQSPTLQSPAGGAPVVYHASASLKDRAEVDAWIDEIVAKHGFERARVRALMDRVKPDERVMKLIVPTSGASYRRVWREYRQRFQDPVRLDAGAQFWQANRAHLERAEREYGVPPEIVCAILGNETMFGKNMGNYRVVDALGTLGFDYPPRAPYFRNELTQFLLYARENRIDPEKVLGSYAGAIGMPQFMPTSLHHFAVDFDGNGVIDLRQSSVDAIGSVANFLKEHGWVREQPTHFRAQVSDIERAQPAVADGPEPKQTLSSLTALGVSSPDPVPETMPIVLADLVNGDAPPDFVLGTRNFYVITRYNRSYFYAMSVIEVGQAIRARVGNAARGTGARP